MMRSLATAALALATLTSTTLGWAASMPLPGVEISNTATATFFDEKTGLFTEVVSNTVSATVNAITGLTVDTDQTVTMTPDETSQFVFTVTNTGNTPADA
ncbi:MAG: hypothetical protein AAFO79_02355, partial [Pseudomonadota bacterium]